MKLVKTLLITGLTSLSISAFAGETIEQAPATTPEAQLNVQADAQAPQDALAQGTAPTEEHLNQAADAKASDKAGDKVALEEEQDKKDKQ